MTKQQPSGLDPRGPWLLALLCLVGIALGACASTRPRATLGQSAAVHVEAPPAVSETRPRAIVGLMERPRPRLNRQRRTASVSSSRTRGTARLGAPYRVAGIWYVPSHQPDYDKVGIASWYGDFFNGRATASGERFEVNGISAAHPTLPLSTLVEVTNLDNGKTIQVRLNDRGPFARNRIIDLSRGAAQQLGFLRSGLARVRVRYVEPIRSSPRLEYARLDAPAGEAQLKRPTRAVVRPRARLPSDVRMTLATHSLALAYEVGMQRIGYSANRSPGAPSISDTLPLW